MIPSIIRGGHYTDERGKLVFNNSFDLSSIKRMYVIENNLSFIRKWQGHKIEERWFTAIKGSFIIDLIEVDDWNNPSKTLEKQRFDLKDLSLDVLHVPPGYISSIQSLSEGAKLLAMSNYRINEVIDDYRFSIKYFEN